MSMKKIILTVACLALSAVSFAADALGIAEPIGKGGVTENEIEGLWGILETCVQSDRYTVISRAALKQMMTEIGFVKSSDLIDIGPGQKAKLGKIKGVKYIMVTEVAKVGTRLNCTMRILDVSTGEIEKDRTANMRVKDIDQLADEIEPVLKRMLGTADDSRCIILNPEIKSEVAAAYDYLSDDFRSDLGNSLTEKCGFKILSLQSIGTFLNDKDMHDINHLDLNDYKIIGTQLEAGTIFRTNITTFLVTRESKTLNETGRQRTIYNATISGDVTVIAPRSGIELAKVPFTEAVSYNVNAPSASMDLKTGKDVIGKAVAEVLVPGILKAPQFAKELEKIRKAGADGTESAARENSGKEVED
ncbi:MAG: hypothetical protein J5944_00015 [Lentisphaeria bacterium]|nr:hypothetical protein [Lentisphaeria bacterium]